MDIINILPDNIANQIAAGEVVDRPASAVKELLENAMDAGASSIQLIVKDAGRTLIQVVDNGCGMSHSDARLCFERHATSKIHRADDLFAIRTMGFRGEALASIAAVAQVELRTSQIGSELGTRILIEGSQLVDQAPCSCPPGTSISVKNLFFNIPARRNFLKKDSIELSHIEEVFRRIALPNYNIAFSFHHNGRLLYDLKASNFAQRIAALFGSGFNQRLYNIQEQTQPVKIFGYVGKAEYARHTRGEQYLFVNNRFIKHPPLSAAIEKAYNELIPDHTYPSYFVLLDVDPSRLDVNIHPTKTEVRFIDENVIFAILRAATKKALGQYTLANELEFNPSTEIDFTPSSDGHIPAPPQISYNPSYNPFRTHTTNTHPSPTDITDDSHIQTPQLQLPNENDYRTDNAIYGNEEESATYQHIDNPPLQLGRYIVTTLKSGIAVIDRQYACERITYERLLARFNTAADTPQQLLFPVNLRLNAGDSELLAELMPDLRHAGFVISPLGQNTFVVTAAPTDLKDTEVQSAIEQTISDFRNNTLQQPTSRDKSICSSLAKHLAASKSQTLKTEEMQQIIASLFSCQAPGISPSGKPTMTLITNQEISERLK